MRYKGLVGVALIIGAASPVMAQEYRGPRTLDSQYQQMNGGAPAPVAIPAGGYSEQSATTVTRTQRTAGGPIDSLGSGAIPMVPIDVQSAGSVSYLSGGISDEELDILKSKYSDFTVHLLMTGPRGAYMSQISVRIMDASGKEVFTAADTGPYLYVALPAGSYSVEATSQSGETKRAKVSASARGGKTQLVFKEA